jgi:hypothetical protein
MELRMSAIEEIDKQLDEYINKFVKCTTCKWWERELFGGYCNCPELPLGFMEHDDSMCEQHEFRDIEMERKMNELTDRRVNAWKIVEGFYTSRMEKSGWIY